MLWTCHRSADDMQTSLPIGRMRRNFKTSLLSHSEEQIGNIPGRINEILRRAIFPMLSRQFLGGPFVTKLPWTASTHTNFPAPRYLDEDNLIGRQNNKHRKDIRYPDVTGGGGEECNSWDIAWPRKVQATHLQNPLCCQGVYK